MCLSDRPMTACLSALLVTGCLSPRRKIVMRNNGIKEDEDSEKLLELEKLELLELLEDIILLPAFWRIPR